MLQRRPCTILEEEDVIFFVYFLSACVLMRTWRFAVMPCVCPLINYTLATEENVRNVRVCACYNHFPITWNKFYDNTQLETISNIRTRYIFQSFFRENIGDFTDLHNEKKNNLEVTFKRYRFGYWNSCKRLPNFVKVAALILAKSLKLRRPAWVSLWRKSWRLVFSWWGPCNDGHKNALIHGNILTFQAKNLILVILAFYNKYTEFHCLLNLQIIWKLLCLIIIWMTQLSLCITKSKFYVCMLKYLSQSSKKHFPSFICTDSMSFQNHSHI